MRGEGPKGRARWPDRLLRYRLTRARGGWITPVGDGLPGTLGVRQVCLGRAPTTIRGWQVDVSHRDFPELDEIRGSLLQRARENADLAIDFPALVREALDYVLDPVRTARTTLSELDNVEKTFIGLKVEHLLRDYLNVPKGVRDLRIGDRNVDVKNTVGSTWMIPKETYSEAGACLLIRIDELTSRCWLGLLKARSEYLSAPNRDSKRAVSASGRTSILWIVDGADYPASRWSGLDMERFRDLRGRFSGAKRAATFFQENLGKRVHRSILQSLLWDQKDYMKRLRGNGGARDLLAPLGIKLLSGAYDSAAVELQGSPRLPADEFVAIRVS